MRPLTAQMLDPALNQARERYTAQSDAWVHRQAARLRVSPETVLLAVKKGVFAERIAELSPIAFAAEMSGRSTVCTNRDGLRFLQKMRTYFTDSAVPSAGTMAASIAASKQRHRAKSAIGRAKAA